MITCVVKSTLFAFLCCLLLGMCCVCDAGEYTASVIASTSSSSMIGRSISSSNVVLGKYEGPDTYSQFLWTKDGGAVEVGSPAVYFNGAPTALGQIVGSEQVTRAQFFAVVREADGSLRRLPYLDPSDTAAGASDVSDNGLAIGISQNETSTKIVIWDLATGAVTQIAEGELGLVHGAAASTTGYAAWTYDSVQKGLRSFRRSPSGVVTELTPPASVRFPFVRDIAADGTLLFYESLPSGSWLWNPDGSMTHLALEGALAMSDNGLILGWLGDRNVVLGKDGSLSDLPLPEGAMWARLGGINDRGAVAGWAAFGDAYRAVIWEPVPEPSSLSFFSLALAGVGFGAVRRRR